MKKEDLFHAIGDVDENKLKEAERLMMENGNERTYGKKQKLIRLFARPAAAVLALALISGLGLSAYALELDRRYNAAVGYLQSLGIEAEDLSDYSRAEVREAAGQLRATEPAPEDVSPKYMALYEKVYAKVTDPPVRPTAPAAVTSEQVRTLTPTMTLKEVTDILGDTVDVGSGLCILLYEVDGDYTLSIPFTGLDAQLGVTGETLLKALQPK